MRSVWYLFKSSDIFLHVSLSTTATVNDCCWLSGEWEHPLIPTKVLHDEQLLGQQQRENKVRRRDWRWKLQMSALYLNCRKLILLLSKQIIIFGFNNKAVKKIHSIRNFLFLVCFKCWGWLLRGIYFPNVNFQFCFSAAFITLTLDCTDCMFVVLPMLFCLRNKRAAIPITIL